jgi:hypothetical protein
MDIEAITSISIPGFQAKLYSFSYSAGFADAPGSVDAEFIGETIVDEVDLTENYFCKIEGISGSYGFFTPVSYEINEMPSYSLLKVRFLDKSMELDKYFVAVRGQIGYDPIALAEMSEDERNTVHGVSPISPKIIWIGDGKSDCEEFIQGQIDAYDPCDPNAEPIFLFNCRDHYLKNKRTYKYTLNDFISAVKKFGIDISGVGGDIAMKFDHSGTIRQVLNAICSDLGMTFCYNPVTSGIKLIDLKSGIKINAGLFGCDIMEYSRKSSKENAKDVFGTAFFQRDSEDRKYSTSGTYCQKLLLSCFTVDDLFDAPPYFDTLDKFEAACVLTGQIGRKFRDVFFLYNHYGCWTPQHFEGTIGKKFSALNGMTVTKVFHSGSGNTTDRATYETLKKTVFGEDVDGGGSHFFFLAKTNETYNELMGSLESTLCNNFLGQYWVRSFSENFKSLDYNYIAPDGNVQYYDKRSPISLPFADITNSVVTRLKDCPLLSVDEENRTTESFLLLTKPAPFIVWPSLEDERVAKVINDCCEKYYFKEVPWPSGFESSMGGSPPEYKIFVMPILNIEEGKNPFTYERIDIEHPEEKENVNITKQTCGKLTSYGLTDGGCTEMFFNFPAGKLRIACPVQATKDEGRHGYTVLAQMDGGETPSSIIPKLEVFHAQPVPNNEESVSIEFNPYNATSNDLNLLLKIQQEHEGNPVSPFCGLDADQIEALLQSVSPLLNYSVGISHEETYKLKGVPSIVPSPLDGLKSLSISVGSSGITSSITYSTTLPIPKGVDYFLKKLRYANLPKVSRPFAMGKTANTSIEL